MEWGENPSKSVRFYWVPSVVSFLKNKKPKNMYLKNKKTKSKSKNHPPKRTLRSQEGFSVALVSAWSRQFQAPTIHVCLNESVATRGQRIVSHNTAVRLWTYLSNVQGLEHWRMGRTRQDRTKIKEEKKKRQNSDYEASLKEPRVSIPAHVRPPDQTSTHQRKEGRKEGRSGKIQQGGHSEDIKGYKNIPKQQQQKVKKIWLSHV